MTNRKEILKNAVALPGEAGTEHEEQKYPLLGSIIFYGVRDLRILRTDLAALFTKHNIPASYLPGDVRPVDAFKRATKSIESGKPKLLPDGTYEVLLVRDVADTKDEFVRQVTREVRVSKESTEPLDYSRVATLVFRRDIEDYIPHSLTPEIESAIKESVDTYKEFLNYFVGSKVRETIREIVGSTAPVTMKPFSPIYFVSREHLALMDSLEGLVLDLIPYQVATDVNWDNQFTSIPLLDIEKQRKLIFEKYSAQVEGSVDDTLAELSLLLKGTKVPSIEAKTKYVKQVKELREGIAKYEKLLEKDLTLARFKADILQEQVLQIVNMVEINPQPSAAV